MTSPVTTFQLIALSWPDAGAPTTPRHLGTHPDLDTALRARVDHVLTQLAANDGWLITAQHLVIGPGPDGTPVVCSYVTEIGADPADDRIPDPHNEPAARGWLLAAHGLSR
jgi:hypothetical protein